MPEGPSAGFPPIEGPRARVLILGSLPGQASIDAGEYYAHPRNGFWPIMRAIADAGGSYVERKQALIRHGITVWDVLRQSVRPGSLDSAIRMDTAVSNDFAALFARQPGIVAIGFNGRKAEAMFQRLVEIPPDRRLEMLTLPSTSPAYASLSVEQKLEIWRSMIGPFLPRRE